MRIRYEVLDTRPTQEGSKFGLICGNQGRVRDIGALYGAVRVQPPQFCSCRDSGQELGEISHHNFLMREPPLEIRPNSMVSFGIGPEIRTCLGLDVRCMRLLYVRMHPRLWDPFLGRCLHALPCGPCRYISCSCQCRKLPERVS